MLFIASTLLLTALLSLLTYQSALLLRRFVPQGNILLNAAENGFKLGFVAACALSAWLSGLPAAAFGLAYDLPTLARDILLGLALGVVIQFIVNFASDAAVQRWGANIYNDLVMRNITPRDGATAGIWLAVGGAMALAVLIEELLFRGLLLGGFGWLLGGGCWYVALAIASSLLFGSLHLPQGQLGVYGAGLLSLVLATLFLLSGDLVAPLVAHFVINILQVIKAHRERIWLQPALTPSPSPNAGGGEITAPSLDAADDPQV